MSLQEVLSVEHYTLGNNKEPWRNLQAIIERFQPDVVYGQTVNAMADMVKCKTSSGLVVDSHGDYPFEILEQEHRPLSQRLFSFTRRRIGEALARRVRPLGKPVKVLWGGVHMDQFKPNGSRSSLPIRVAYAGNYRSYQGVDMLLEAAATLVQSGQPFHFLFIGNMDEFPAVKRQVKESLGDRATVTGQVPYSQVPQLLQVQLSI
jgi:glycosyltransferase involved in cell wall biosynthesis